MSGSAGAWIALGQGGFYVATGVWAPVDLDSSVGRISPIYRFDAAAEVALACVCVVARRRG